MEIILLHNRTAGDQEPSPGRLLDLLRGEGFAPRYFDLHEAMKNPAALPNAGFAVVAGGDGSFRKVALRLGARGMPLALLPVGTANNVARSLGLPDSMAEVIASWHTGRRIRFDVGIARGPWGEERFVEGVGAGLFARIINILARVEVPEAQAQAERPHRVASDLRSTTVLAHEMAPVLVEATLDGERLSGQFLLLEIMNIGHVGAGIELAKADVSDGRFDVVMARLSERENLLETLGNVARNTPAAGKLDARSCRDVELIVPPCEFRVDDRVIPVTDPARIQIAMSAEPVEILVPPATGRGGAGPRHAGS